MKFAFTGALVVELRLRLLGTSIARQLRANYEYTPSWPYLDPKTGTEVTRDEALKLDLEILARPRAEKLPHQFPPPGKPYWTSARDLLAFGVLNRCVYDQLDVMIDNDARVQDQERRQNADPGARSLPNVL